MFDWHSAPLQNATVITGDFRVTQNVRRFFHEQLGRKVNFSRDFMDWMRANVGGTLGEALTEYQLRFPG